MADEAKDPEPEKQQEEQADADDDADGNGADSSAADGSPKGGSKGGSSGIGHIGKTGKIIIIIAIVAISFGIAMFYSEDIISFMQSLLNGGAASAEATAKYIAMGNETVRNFMDNHTNATMQLSFFRREEAGLIFRNMQADCGIGNDSGITEIYRITMQDAASGRTMVAWVDWTGRRLVCAARKSGNWTELCGHHASLRCNEGDVYWFDSCGNPDGIKQSCFGICANASCRPSCIIEGKAGRSSGNITCCTGLVSTPNSTSSGGACPSPINQSFLCTRCGDGLCIAPEGRCSCPRDCNETCIDSDGRAYNISGKVTKGNVTMRDKCEMDTSLTEYYCEFNAIKSEKHYCAYGYECMYGRCVNVTYPCVDEGGVEQKLPQYTCCAGLAMSDIMMEENGCDKTPGAFVCIKCGDDKCGPGENHCNCPAECEPGNQTNTTA